MESKIIMTKGLPASGKSTWAKKLQADNPGIYKRVNKDDLRAMLDDKKWAKHNEEFVLMIRDMIIEEALVGGWSVIVDDTNLHPKHEATIRAIADKFEIKLEIKDFTDVEPITCIERDMERMEPVGEKVIWKMFDQFLSKDNRVL